jgi:hypothetical protein
VGAIVAVGAGIELGVKVTVGVGLTAGEGVTLGIVGDGEGVAEDVWVGVDTSAGVRKSGRLHEMTTTTIKARVGIKAATPRFIMATLYPWAGDY